MPEVISADEFQKLARRLVGLPVSKVWRGFGSAIFLEFGRLSRNGAQQAKGEGTAMPEWSWRVEKARSVMFGSCFYRATLVCRRGWAAWSKKRVPRWVKVEQ